MRQLRQADLHTAPLTEPATRATTRAVEYVPYRAGMVLLATLVAYPALGPALFLRLHHRTMEAPASGWDEFLAGLQPVPAPGGWSNSADPYLTAVQAQQWQALLQGLRTVTCQAATVGLPLPEPLAAWAEWLVDVGRLSFPTGRVVGALDRQPAASDSRFPQPLARVAVSLWPQTTASHDAAVWFGYAGRRYDEVAQRACARQARRGFVAINERERSMHERSMTSQPAQSSPTKDFADFAAYDRLVLLPEAD